MCHIQVVLKVALPGLYLHSREALLYLQQSTCRKWQWGATETLQIVVLHV